MWNARGVVVGDTEGPPKCFVRVRHQLLALQWHICGGAFHASPPWVERHVHDQIQVVGFQ